MRSRRFHFVVLAAAVLLAAGAGVDASNPFEPAIRAASPSVVRISSIIPARLPLIPAPQINVTSGVVVGRDGYVATSLSGLAGASRPTVMLSDGTQTRASIAKADLKLDLAILRISAEGLDPIEVAAATPHVGQWVLAIGNPFGLAQTRTDPLSVSVGVVSAVGPVEASDYPYTGPLIVSDVIINPGASGGAMVDLDGKLVGLCGRVITMKRTNTQVSIAVPAAEVTKLLEEARKAAPPAPVPTPRPPAPLPTPAPTPPVLPTPEPAPVPGKTAEGGYLGVYVIDDALGSRGAYIERVVPGSPAEDAGLAEGDLITAVNAKPVAHGRQFLQTMEPFAVGQRIELTVRRDNAEIKISATLAKTPKSVLR